MCMCDKNDMLKLSRKIRSLCGAESGGTCHELTCMSFQTFRRRCLEIIRNDSDIAYVLKAYLGGGVCIEYRKNMVHVYRSD